MKKLIPVFFVLYAGIAAAQKVKVSESKEKIGGGNNNAMVVTVYEATMEEIEKGIKSFMKYFNAKVSTKSGEMFGDNGVVKDWGNNTVDIYAKFDKVKDGETKVMIAFDLGGAFLNSSEHSEKYKYMKELVEKTVVEIQKDAIANQLKSAEKQLSKLEDEQKSLEKKNKNLKEDIEDYKKKIANAEADLKKNDEDQQRKKGEIASQSKIVETIRKKQQATD